MQLYEALEPGSTTYVPSNITTLAPARRVRVIDVSLDEIRSTQRSGAAARKRFKINDASLQTIRAEMPTSSDDWQVESVVQVCAAPAPAPIPVPASAAAAFPSLYPSPPTTHALLWLSPTTVLHAVPCQLPRRAMADQVEGLR